MSSTVVPPPLVIPDSPASIVVCLPDVPVPAIVLNSTELPQWLRDIEQQTKCPICCEVSSSGYVRLACDCYLCGSCAQNLSKYTLDVSTHYSDHVFATVKCEPFACPRCRAPSDLEPNLVIGNRGCDSNFLCLRAIYQSVRLDPDYLNCSCASGRHDNDNAWVNCPRRASVCSWCAQNVLWHGSSSLEVLGLVYDHLSEHCTHLFECRYCNLVDRGAWRQLGFTYRNLSTHCKVHRLAFNLLHRTRELMYALYPAPHTFNSDVMQFWVSHVFSLVRVIEVESRQTMFCDDACVNSARSNAIRRRIGSLIAHTTPNSHTQEVAPSFHEFIFNVKWARQDRPPNVMEVLPALLRLIYQDSEPQAITDPEFLQAFLTEANHESLEPERQGSGLLASILQLAQSTTPPPPPPLSSLSVNQYGALDVSTPFRVARAHLMRLPSMLTRLEADRRTRSILENQGSSVEDQGSVVDNPDSILHNQRSILESSEAISENLHEDQEPSPTSEVFDEPQLFDELYRVLDRV